jgi:hypothetical protein
VRFGVGLGFGLAVGLGGAELDGAALDDGPGEADTPLGVVSTTATRGAIPTSRPLIQTTTGGLVAVPATT